MIGCLIYKPWDKFIPGIISTGTYQLILLLMGRWLTKSFLFFSFHLLCNPLSTLPAVRHTTSWRKTGKYTRHTKPAPSPKIGLNQQIVLFGRQNLCKAKYFKIILSASWFGRGFRSTNVLHRLPRGSSKQNARAKHIPRMHAWNKSFVSKQKIWVFHQSFPENKFCSFFSK